MTLAAGAELTGHDTRLIVAALAGIALIVVLVAWAKLHPFLALILGSGLMGFVAGYPVADLLKSFEDGVGSTVASVGTLIALGTMLGRLLADSGGADQVVDTILAHSGPRRLPWAMALIAAIVGLPMFFEIGLVILVPVILLTARRGNVSLLRVGIPGLAGLSVLHGLVPPHPGPLIAIANLDANLGLTLALGLAVAVPTVIVAGPVYGSLISKRIAPTPPEGLLEELTHEPIGQRRPSFGVTLGTILLPVVLMLVRAVVDVVEDKHEGAAVRRVFDFVGDPFVALLIGVLVAMVTLGTRLGVDRQTLSRTLGASLAPIAGILLIVAGGGGFKQVLVDVGLGDVIKHLATGSHVSVLLLGWLVAVGIRLATGSATVATVTASGIVSSLASSLDSPHVALLALAVGAGSLFFSHVNDAGFWLVKEYFGMSVGETIRSWSVMETIISVVAIACILLLGVVV